MTVRYTFFPNSLPFTAHIAEVKVHGAQCWFELTSLSFNFKDLRIFPWCEVSEVRAVDFWVKNKYNEKS